MAVSRSKPPRLLIVSNGWAGEHAAELLRELPYELEFADARESCLEAVTQRPQLVLLDFALTGSDPLALCLEIASIDPNLPILALAESDTDEAVERVFGAGADDVVFPPLRQIILRQRIGRLVKEADLVQRVRDQDRLNHQLFDQNNVMRLVIEPDNGAILDANPAACTFYSYTREQLRARRLNDLDAYPARQMMQRAFRATSYQETYFVFTHRLGTGEMREVEMYCAPMEYGGRRATQVVLHDITQRKQVEQRLRDSEERYLKILEMSNDAVFTLSRDTTVTFISGGGFTSIAGNRPEDWLGKSFVPMIYFDDLPLALSMVDMVLRGEIPPPFELRFNSIDGYNYGEVIVSPQIENREVVGIWGAVRDVTQRKMAEQSEREQRALAEALRDTAAALNATLDLDELFGRILVQVERVVPSDTANIMLIEDGVARVVRCRGYAERGIEDDILGLRFIVDQMPNMRYMIDSGLPFVEPDVDQYEGWVITSGTAWIRSHVAAPILINGKVIGFLNLDSARVNQFVDLDAERLKAFADQAATAFRNAELYEAVRRQTEELERRVAERTAQLVHERAQLRTILDSMNEGVIYDEQFQVRYINRALTELVGYTILDWQGYLEKLWSQEVPEAELRRTMDSLYDSITAGQEWTGEMRLRGKEGTEFDAAIMCSPVRNADGELSGAVTVIRDISQEKALQVQKQRFVAFASHELRTPITNLKTRLYLMRRQPGNLDGHLEILDEVTERMKRLVEDLLDTSRFERGVIELQSQMVDMRRLTQSVVRLQEPEAAQKDVSLHLALPDDTIEVYGDSERITQVITNLVVNAINYTQDGGSVTVAVYAASPRDPFVTIDVQDTGVGIPAEHLPNIFQPFYRVDKRTSGTGLGLSITHQIVELHGGSISVDSTVGTGSTFHVRLPSQAPTEKEPVAPSGPANVVQHP
jgi:two-component system phosphate regulon sensor histidine kinase PhoR